MSHVHNDNHTEQLIGSGRHAETVVKPLGDAAPQQPCSGVTLIGSVAFGAGVAASSPSYVCVVKTAA